jgi:ATPase subunit of ABC transporter with duplicated ATPase domains
VVAAFWIEGGWRPRPIPPTGAAKEQVAVAAEGLERSFGATTALRGVDLEVAAETIFALLGHNGAAKTTLTPASSQGSAVAGRLSS